MNEKGFSPILIIVAAVVVSIMAFLSFSYGMTFRAQLPKCQPSRIGLKQENSNIYLKTHWDHGFEAYIGKRVTGSEVKFNIVANFLPDDFAPYDVWVFSVNDQGDVCTKRKIGRLTKHEPQDFWTFDFTQKDYTDDSEILAISTHQATVENLNSLSIELSGSFKDTSLNESSEPRTYNNSQFGFEFKYDGASYLSEGKGQYEELVLTLSNEKINKHLKGTDKYNFFSLKVYHGDFCRYVGINKKTIDSISTSYTEAFDPNTKQNIIKACFLKDNYGYYFESFTENETDFNLAKEEFNRIISTFKFTKQLSSNVFRKDADLYHEILGKTPTLIQMGVDSYRVTPSGEYIIYTTFVSREVEV
jgi:hypothetical protein